jgi:LCP family protein required for cell wall assembly
MEKSKTNQILKIVLIATVVLVVVFAAVIVFRYVIPLTKMYNEFEVQTEAPVTPVAYSDTDALLEEEDDEPEVILSLNELRSADDLSTALREWSENTDDYVLMKSKKVINFLLIGGDEKQELADVLMLVSLNKDTKKIYINSIMRDSYTYIPIKNSDTYGKINSVYTYGGANLVKDTVERNFKIQVDYYVYVNYDMFMGIIDTLGGITLDVQEYEARAVRTEDQFVALSEYNGQEPECPWGEQVTLNGLQALTFCRIRHCDVDADISRTRRQRQFISALIDRSKDVTMDQLDAILDQFSVYIRTDATKSELAKLASQAILNHWADYEIVSNSFPQEGERLDYNGYSWVWIVDYPLSAYHMQNLIYGESNIILNEDRVSVIDIMEQTGNVGTAAP